MRLRPPRPSGRLALAVLFRTLIAEARRKPANLLRCRIVRRLLCSPVMPNIHDDPAALKALQDAIYRDKVLRARRMTEQERLAEVFELSNHQFGMMLAGAMHRLGTSDEAEGWKEVRRWMDRLTRAREHGLYVKEKPATA